jgi:hypothetical protein
VDRQELWRQGLLGEVEIGDQIADSRVGVPNDRSGIGTSVRRRVESLTAKEVVLDEPDVRVMAEDRVIDIATPVTYVCPALMRFLGCSPTVPLGMIHETAGRCPLPAARKKFDSVCTLPSWWSWP